MTLLNLTPHPIRIYPADTPDRIDPYGSRHLPVLILEPCDQPARIGEIELGTNPLAGCPVPVEYVEFAAHGGTVHPLPPKGEAWLVVSLAVGLLLTYGQHNRSDLLVPYREVRNMDGTVIGCRHLARPV